MVGMRFDLKTARPIISVKKGGYSGKGIYPVALRMIYEVYEAVNIPLIGMGGVSSPYDVIEMMYAGASLVMVGSENLINPYACKEIIDSLDKVMEELKITDLESIIGKAHDYE
jgi:dihydroorotate dehydrogenase (NAD+) catalytic subunit